METLLAPVIGVSILGLVATLALGVMLSDQGKWPEFIDWLIACFVVLLLISFGALGTREADAHEAPSGWSYPLSCCSNFDCREVPGGAVEERPEGFVIPGTGEVVPMTDKRIRNSPDGKFHWCAHQPGVDAGRTICLFVPPRGS